MSNCYHLIGMLNDYENTKLVNVEDIIRIHNDKVAVRKYTQDLWIKAGYTKEYAKEKSLELFAAKNITDYADKRKSLIQRFEFCPLCGERLDWKNIKKQLKEE